MWTAIGAITGTMFVLVLGYLSMRISAAQDGVALHPISNDIDSVVGPHIPLLPLAITAVVGCVAICALMLSVIRLTPGSAAAANIAFALVIFALAVASYTVWEFGPAIPELGAAPYSGGLFGWLRIGGRDSLTMTTALIAITSLALRPLITRRPAQVAHSATPD